MKEDFEKRLAAIIADAATQAPQALYAALHMAYGCYLKGKEESAAFAKHCCAFSQLALRKTDVIEAAKGTPKKPVVVN